MHSIYTKVNGKGQFKEYMNGTYFEMKAASNDLISRATAKGFKMVCRSCGNAGVVLTYSNGETKVEIAYITCESERVMLYHIYKSN